MKTRWRPETCRGLRRVTVGGWNPREKRQRHATGVVIGRQNVRSIVRHGGARPGGDGPQALGVHPQPIRDAPHGRAGHVPVVSVARVTEVDRHPVEVLGNTLGRDGERSIQE
jgi:hypothetical protein